MSKIFVLAKAGGGKSSSMRNLPPPRTGIINPDKKALPLKGWKTNYQTAWMKLENGETWPDLLKSNYVETSKFDSVMKTLRTWDDRPDLDFVVIDTATHLLLHDYVTNTIGKEFKDYQKMGKRFYELMDFVREMKKNVAVLAHIETEFNEMGDKVTDMKSPGKMIKSFEPPSFFTTTLIGELHIKEGERKYVFRTQTLGSDPAKSPAYFEGDTVKTALEFYEPNDLMLIFGKLKKFEEETGLAA